MISLFNYKLRSIQMKWLWCHDLLKSIRDKYIYCNRTVNFIRTCLSQPPHAFLYFFNIMLYSNENKELVSLRIKYLPGDFLYITRMSVVFPVNLLWFYIGSFLFPTTICLIFQMVSAGRHGNGFSYTKKRKQTQSMISN
jgi:hypothetical protein